MFCLGFLNSCLNLGDIGPDYPATENEELVKRSCARMNKLTDLLDYDSFKWATVCWGWDQDYPEFYSALLKIDANSWDHIMVPFNKFFFNNKERRDRYLKRFNALDKADLLDDFANFLDTFTENNLNDLFYRILNQTLHEEDSLLQKSTLLKALEILKTEKESLAEFKKFYKATSIALEGDNKNLTPVFKDLISDKGFKVKRVAVIDQFFKWLSDVNVGYFDRYFIDSFISYKENDEGYWFYQWIRKLANDPGPFFKLLSYGNIFHPDAKIDFTNLLEMGPTFSCPASENDTAPLIINTEKIFRTFIERLSGDSFIEFIDFLNRESVDIRLGGSACKISEIFAERGSDIGSLMKNIFGPVRDKQVYHLLKRVHQNILNTELASNQENPYYLIKFYLSDFYQKVAEFNKYLIEDGEGKYLQVLVNIISSYSEKDYETFIYFTKKILESENLEVLNAFGEIWRSLDSIEKDALLNLLDSLFEKDLNYIGLLRFAEEFVEELDAFVPLLANSIAYDDSSKEKTLQAIYDMSQELKGSQALEDLRRIFSRQEILKTVQILAGVISSDKGRGPINPGTIGDNEFQDISTLLEIRDPDCFIQGTCQKELQCFDYLSNSERELGKYILELPLECKSIESDYFSIKLLQYLHRINEESITLGYGTLLTGEGLLGRDIFNESIKNFLSLKKESSPMGIFEVISFLKEVLFANEIGGSSREVGITALEEGLRLLRFLIEIEEGTDDDYITFLKNTLAQKTNEDIGEYFKNFSEILKYYSLSREAREVYQEGHSCQSMFPITYRVESCPDKESIKQNINRILSILKRTFEGKKSALELLLQALSPEHGLDIPFLTEDGEKTYINHVIDFKQYLLYAYDLLQNTETMRFYTGPVKKSDYFDAVITDAEQTDVVIREISFYGNYFGLFYLNATALGDDYVQSAKKVTKEFKWLSSCLNNRFCRFFSKISDIFGKTDLSAISKEARFWSLNAVNSVSSLIDVGNEYEHGGKIFKHDTFIKALISIFVQSSPEDVRFRSKFSKMADNYMERHNGEIILRLGEISAFQNIARFVYDRFGPDKDRLESIIFGDEFQRVNRNLFRGIPLELVQNSLLDVLNKYMGDDGSGKELNTMISLLVDWIEDLPYEKQKIVEEVIGDLIVIFSSLGPDNKDLDFMTFGDLYSLNNIWNYIGSLDNWILIAHDFIQNSPEGFQLFDVFDAIRDPIRFIRNGLSTRKLNFEGDDSDISERRKTFYTFINENFKIFEILMTKQSGIDLSAFLLKKIQQSPDVAWKIFDQTLRTWRKALRSMHFGPSTDGGGGIIENRKKMAQLANLISLYGDKGQFQTNNIRSWVASTSYPLINGVQNTEYKKLIKFIDYLLLSNNEQQTNLHSALDKILFTDYESLEAYIDEMYLFLDYFPPPSNSPPLTL